MTVDKCGGCSIRWEEKYYVWRKKDKVYNNMSKKIVLLGWGEVGKEFRIGGEGLGEYIIGCECYGGGGGMEVGDGWEVLSMLDGEGLEGVVEKYGGVGFCGMG